MAAAPTPASPQLKPAPVSGAGRATGADPTPAVFLLAIPGTCTATAGTADAAVTTLAPPETPSALAPAVPYESEPIANVSIAMVMVLRIMGDSPLL
jgi:hypothetical protein